MFSSFSRPGYSAPKPAHISAETCTISEMPARIAGENTVRVLSWNVQQIPAIATQEYPEGREHCQKQIFEHFNITMMQEAFLNTGPLRENAQWSWRPVFAPGRKLLGYINENFRSPGLMVRADRDVAAIEARPFGNCAGLFNHKNDCLAQKGFQIFKRGDITFVNMHMDAGRAPEDRKARARQLDILFAALPVEGPLVFAGDININDQRPQEHARFLEEAQKAGLTIIEHNKNDVIAVRGVNVVNSGVLEFDRYSDHRALWVDLVLPASQPAFPATRIAANIP